MNTIFFVIIGLIITWLTLYIFLKTAFQGALWLGVGVFTVAFSAFSSGWFMPSVSGQNFNTTVYNSGVLLASVFYLIGTSTLFWRNPLSTIRRKIFLVSIVYLFSLAWVSLISFGASTGVTPVFFIPGSGGTVLRQTVLDVSISLYVVSSLFLLRAYLRSLRSFWIWYSSGLLISAIGMVAISFQTSLGDAVNWLGRSTQYGGAVLLLIAAISIIREARSKRIPVEQLIAQFSSQAIVNYESLVNAASDAIIAVDGIDRILTWNPAAAKVFGYTSKEAVGMPFFNLLINAGQAEVYEKHSESFSANPIVSDTPVMMELKARRRNGEEFPAEVTLASRSLAAGWLPTTTLIVRDITERKRVEEALKESEERFSRAFNCNAAAMAITNMDDGKIININEAFERLSGYSRGEVISHSAIEMNIWADPQQRQTLFSDLAKNKHFHDREATFRVKNSKMITTLYSAETIRLQGKDLILSTVIDITARKKAEEAIQKYAHDLEVANKELEAFNYSVSHDLRKPIRSMESYSDLLKEDYADKLDETAQFYLERIRKGSQLMSQLTDDMLKLSRINRAEMFRDNVNLSNVALSIVAELQASQPERQAIIKVTPDILVSGDKSLLEIALRNLLENAWKFTGKNPQTLIEMGETNREGEKVYFLRDNGCGFDMQYKDRLFKPFERLHTEKEYPGTGIGLAIIQRIIRRHSGRIWAEAEKEKGATFSFTLGEKEH